MAGERRRQRRRQRQRSGFATMAEALAAMQAAQGSVVTGAPPPTRITVAEYLAEWRVSMRGRLRGATWAGYGDIIRRSLVPHLGAMPLRNLTRARVKAFYMELADSTSVRGTPLSSRTVHSIHMVLRTALGAAVEDGLIGVNPADRAHKVAGGRPEMRTWTAEQVRVFLDHVVTAPDGAGLTPRERYCYGLDTRMLPLWRVIATTGMRRGEVLALRWRDIDLEQRVLRVQQARVRGAKGMEYAPPKTAKSRRSIPIDPVTADILCRHREAQATDRDAFGP
ncbi:MAG: site-specific integrase, partial [Chloroflexi bacterium]|nr:site-specific integrase [Chloroflexota bacterium]